LGIDPGPFSLRELWWMSEAIELKDRMAWNRVSALMALQCNINRDPKKTKAFNPSDFNPYLQKQAKQNVIEVKDSESKALFKEAFEGRR
jgi:hypothetical protein